MEPNKPAGVQTEVGNGVLVDRTDAGGGARSAEKPARSLAALRLLVRERMKVYGTPLPDGYVLPEGVTLDALLEPPAGTR